MVLGSAPRPTRATPAHAPSPTARAPPADLLHAGGGLIIVPDDDFVLNVYNFQELKHMDKTHLLRLGLPAPAVTPAPLFELPPPLFRLSNFLADSLAGGPPSQ